MSRACFKHRNHERARLIPKSAGLIRVGLSLSLAAGLAACSRSGGNSGANGAAAGTSGAAAGTGGTAGGIGGASVATGGAPAGTGGGTAAGAGGAGAAGAAGAAAGMGGTAAGTGGAGAAGAAAGTGGTAAGAGGGSVATGGAPAGTGGAHAGAGGAASGAGGAASGAEGVSSGTGGATGGASSGGNGGAPPGTGGASPGVWLPARRLDGSIYRVKLMVDGAGNGLALTASDGTFYKTVFTPDQSGGGAWGPTEALFPCGFCGSFNADMNGQGTGVIAWSDSVLTSNPATYSVAARRRASGGAWEATPTAWSVAGYDNVFSAIVAPTGSIHLYFGASIVEATAGPTGAWTGPVPPGAQIGSLFFTKPGFAAFDAAGNGFLVSNGAGIIDGYRYTAEPPGWSFFDWFDHGTSQSSAVVAVDGQGRAMLLYTHNGGVSYARSSEIPGWHLGGDIAPVLNGQVASVAVASDGPGFFALWSQTVDTTMEMRASRFDGAAWSAPVKISAGSPAAVGAPVIEVDAHGDAVVVWFEGSGASIDVVAARYDASARAWAAPAKITGAPALFGGNPELAVSASGVALAAWSDDKGVAFVRAMR